MASMNSHIESVETVVVDLPLRRVQQFARFGTTTQSTVLIRVRTRQGTEGIGESVTPCGPWWSGDSVESIKATLDTYLAPMLVGADALQPLPLLSKMHRVVRNNSFAKAGVEMALLDLAGRLLEVPVCNLLGGAYRRELKVAWPLATGDVDQELAEGQSMLAAGKAFAFKLKMGALPVSEDLRRAAAIAKAFAGQAGVRADPNEMWDEVTAGSALRSLETAGVELVEQPVPRWNLEAIARLQSKTSIPILLDESIQTSHEVIEAAKKGAAGVISLKLMKTGGLRATKALADVAAAAGFPLYMGTFLETSVGTAANMHLAASLESLPYGGEVIGPLLLEEDICIRPARYINGALQLENGPGLGISLDEAQVQRFSRGKPHFTRNTASSFNKT